jgi:hypothetical protein
MPRKISSAPASSSAPATMPTMASVSSPPAAVRTSRAKGAAPSPAAAAVTGPAAQAKATGTDPAPKPAKPAKAEKPGKVEKTAKPAKAPKAPKAPKAEKAEKTNDTLVRDSFTMPQADFALIAELKARAATSGRPAKKSELLRAGLRLLAAQSPKALAAVLARLEPVKLGRPRQQA